MGPSHRGWRGGFFFCIFLGDVWTHRPKARVSAVEKAEVGLLNRGWKGGNTRNSMGVKWGRNAQRQVSLLHGGTFESWLQSWKLPKNLVETLAEKDEESDVTVGPLLKWELSQTHRPKRVCLHCRRRLRKRRVTVGLLNRGCGEVETLANFFGRSGDAPPETCVSPL